MALFLLETVIDNTGLIVMAVIPLICLLTLYVAMRRAIRQSAEQLRREFEERLSVMTTKARLNEPLPLAQRTPATVAAPIPAPAPVEKAAVVPTGAAEEVTPEMLLVIAAAVTAYLGKAVRIRSARMLYSHESFNAWSQQGRAVIQASHNLAQRGY